MSLDRTLFVLYLCSSLSSLVSLICSTIVWLYWETTLDTCHTNELDFERGCGCVLYGFWAQFYFRGGDIGYCYFLSLAPIPVVVWSGIMSVYHGYREFCAKVVPRVTLISKNKVEAINTRAWSRSFMIFALTISSANACLLLVYNIIFSVGYLKTCYQYKKFIIRQLSAGGSLAKAILDRFSCEVSYDLLDYLQPDPEWLEDRQRRFVFWGGLINTDTALKVVLISSIFTTFAYFFIIGLSVKCLRVPRRATVLNSDL